MPDTVREGKLPPDVPPHVTAGKQRAKVRAIGATLIALATVGLVVLYVARFSYAIGVYPARIVYLVLIVCAALFLNWERKNWRRDDEERVARRRRRFPRPIRPRAVELSRDVPSVGRPVGPVVVRTRPHPARQAVDMWWRQLIVVAIVLAAVASAVTVFLSVRGG